MNDYNNENNNGQDPNQNYGYQQMPPQNYPPQNNMPPMYQQMPYMQPKPPQGLSIAGLVLGIVGVVFSFAFYIGIPCSILALIFGIKSKNTFRDFGLTNGKSTAGIILGIIGIILSIIFLIIIIWAVIYAAESYSSFNYYYGW